MIHRPIFFLVIALALVLSACGSDATDSNRATATPAFFTATLPVPSIPEPTLTSHPPTAVPTVPPIEGTTTTQVNVRAEPSTTSAALGMILPSTKVLVLGKDASGTWYQLLFTEGKGWVIAAYVQVAAGAEVPVIQVGTGSGPSASVLVLQRVNVRSGPGTQFESVGILSPNDVVALTGKDLSGAWLQIEYVSAPEARGWINAEFVQASGAETVPVVDVPGPVAVPGTPAEGQPTPAPAFVPASNDGDSATAPSMTVTFSPTASRAFQFSGDVSAPQGDYEDWVQFTPYYQQVEIQVTCSGSNALLIELLTGESASKNKPACGETQSVTVQVGQTYFIHLASTSEDGPSFTHYTLKVKQLP